MDASSGMTSLLAALQRRLCPVTATRDTEVEPKVVFIRNVMFADYSPISRCLSHFWNASSSPYLSIDHVQTTIRLMPVSADEMASTHLRSSWFELIRNTWPDLSPLAAKPSAVPPFSTTDIPQPIPVDVMPKFKSLTPYYSEKVSRLRPFHLSECAELSPSDLNFAARDHL